MLYDPKWEVTADPFTLESLIAWLEKMPADREYCFYLSGQCLMGQWLKSIDPNVDHKIPGDSYTYRVLGRLRNFRREFSGIAGIRPHTFGAALTRARAALHG
jgi:hypothetical protein